MDESALLDADITADFIQAERLLLDKDLASADPATSTTAPAAAAPQRKVVKPGSVSESADAPATTRAPRQATMSAQNKIAALNAVNV